MAMPLRPSWANLGLSVAPASPQIRCDVLKPCKFGSPGRIRTSDPAVNSRLLYLLSYRGAERAYEAQLGRVIANAGMARQSFTGGHLRGPCGQRAGCGASPTCLCGT